MNQMLLCDQTNGSKRSQIERSTDNHRNRNPIDAWSQCRHCPHPRTTGTWSEGRPVYPLKHEARVGYLSGCEWAPQMSWKEDKPNALKIGFSKFNFGRCRISSTDYIQKGQMKYSTEEIGWRSLDKIWFDNIESVDNLYTVQNESYFLNFTLVTSFNDNFFHSIRNRFWFLQGLKQNTTQCNIRLIY